MATETNLYLTFFLDI